VRGWGRGDSYPPKLDQDCIELLDRIVQVEFSRRVAQAARKLAYMYQLKNYDAIHLASAVDAGVDVLMTWDKGFPLGQRVEGVWVDEPYEFGPLPIPGI
jgi:predicted nucleic acid-binding protein